MTQKRRQRIRRRSQENGRPKRPHWKKLSGGSSGWRCAYVPANTKFGPVPVKVPMPPIHKHEESVIRLALRNKLV